VYLHEYYFTTGIAGSLSPMWVR